jgi:hypothetical protein
MSLQRKEITTKAGAKLPRHAIPLIPKLSPKSARPDLAAMVHDQKLDIRHRTVAAMTLAKVADPGVVTDLEALVDAEGPIAQVALRALGRRGTAKSLEALDRAKDKQRPRATRMEAMFAAAMIAHRLDLPDHDLPSPPARAKLLPWVAAGSREMKFEKADPKEVARMHETLAANAPGLALGKQGWMIECRGLVSLFALSETLADKWDAAAFAKRKFHVGQLALRNLTNGNYSPGLAILSDPDGAGGAIISVYRSAGTLMMAGRGKPDGQQIRVQLGTVDRIAAFPMDLQIVVGANTLDVVTANVGPGTKRFNPKPMAR